MFDYVVGLGQGGSRIAASFSKYFKIPGVYFNFSKVDFSKFKPPGGGKFVLSDGGTGRDPGVGEDLANKYKKDLYDAFKRDMERQKVYNRDVILICVGGGGGSGCGLLKVILPYLTNEFENTFLIYTLPEKREKLPAKPNSLITLNWVIENHLKNNEINLLLVDNEYSCKKYFSDDFRFKGINKVLPKAFDRFFKITDIYEEYRQLDFAAGYSALDFRELKKVLLYSHGFCDMRSFKIDDSWIDMEDNELRKVVRTSSLFIGSFDINTSKIALCSISIPDSYKGEKISPFIDRIFDIVGRMTRAPIVFNSSYYNKKVDKIRVDIILGGLIKSKSLKSLINQAIKDKILLSEKGEVESLDLEELNEF